MGTVWQTPEDQLKVEDGREEVEIGEGSVLASYKKILGGCNFFFFFSWLRCSCGVIGGGGGGEIPWH